MQRQCSDGEIVCVILTSSGTTTSVDGVYIHSLTIRNIVLICVWPLPLYPCRYLEHKFNSAEKQIEEQIPENNRQEKLKQLTSCHTQHGGLLHPYLNFRYQRDVLTFMAKETKTGWMTCKLKRWKNQQIWFPAFIVKLLDAECMSGARAVIRGCHALQLIWSIKHFSRYV